MNKTVVGLGIGLALVGFLLATTGVDHRDADEDSRAVSGTQAPRLAVDPLRAEAQEEADVVVVAVVDGEDARSADWDTLTPDQRIAFLRRDIEDALASMRRGESGTLERAKADAALSALRAELYGTAEGRAQHRRLEEQIEALVDRDRAQGEASSLHAERQP